MNDCVCMSLHAQSFRGLQRKGRHRDTETTGVVKMAGTGSSACQVNLGAQHLFGGAFLGPPIRASQTHVPDTSMLRTFQLSPQCTSPGPCPFLVAPYVCRSIILHVRLPLFLRVLLFWGYGAPCQLWAFHCPEVPRLLVCLRSHQHLLCCRGVSGLVEGMTLEAKVK